MKTDDDLLFHVRWISRLAWVVIAVATWFFVTHWM